MTKNLTLSLDEDLLAKYRVLAAEQRTTVNALIRKHMEEVTGMSTASASRREAREWMLEQGRKNLERDAATPAREGPSIWNRADIYADHDDKAADAA